MFKSKMLWIALSLLVVTIIITGFSSTSLHSLGNFECYGFGDCKDTIESKCPSNTVYITKNDIWALCDIGYCVTQWRILCDGENGIMVDHVSCSDTPANSIGCEEL